MSLWIRVILYNDINYNILKDQKEFKHINVIKNYMIPILFDLTLKTLRISWSYNSTKSSLLKLKIILLD